MGRLFNMKSTTRQVGGDHYLSMGIQPWAALSCWLSGEEMCGYLRGSAIAYLARAGKKGSMIEDIKKAQHYLEHLIELLEHTEDREGEELGFCYLPREDQQKYCHD